MTESGSSEPVPAPSSVNVQNDRVALNTAKEYLNSQLRLLQPLLRSRASYIRNSPFIARQFSLIRQSHKMVQNQFYSTPSEGLHFISSLTKGVLKLLDNLRPNQSITVPPSTACVVCFVQFADNDIVLSCPYNHHYHSYCLQRTFPASSVNYYGSRFSIPHFVKCLCCCVANINVCTPIAVRTSEAAHSPPQTATEIAEISTTEDP